MNFLVLALRAAGDDPRQAALHDVAGVLLDADRVVLQTLRVGVTNDLKLPNTSRSSAQIVVSPRKLLDLLQPWRKDAVLLSWDGTRTANFLNYIARVLRHESADSWEVYSGRALALPAALVQGVDPTLPETADPDPQAEADAVVSRLGVWFTAPSPTTPTPVRLTHPTQLCVSRPTQEGSVRTACVADGILPLFVRSVNAGGYVALQAYTEDLNRLALSAVQYTPGDAQSFALAQQLEDLHIPVVPRPSSGP